MSVGAKAGVGDKVNVGGKVNVGDKLRRYNESAPHHIRPTLHDHTRPPFG